MAEKLKQVGRYWGSQHEEFRGYGSIDVRELIPFEGSHPAVMENWLATEAETEFSSDPDYRMTRRDRRNRLRFWLEDVLGFEVSKKHFKRVD